VARPLTRRALDTGAAGAAKTQVALPEVVGVSSDMVRVRHLAILAARSDVNVLITGETGAGKELVARAIHRLSGLAGRPFIGHNCATTTAEMFDSEFFGHVRGAFSGADRDHVGLLASANGSVLMLDELESMGLAQQAKLLRVMDDGEVRPVGASSLQSVSVRFLAATNRDPGKMLEDGTLRKDLYYRLRGLEIRIPPPAARSGRPTSRWGYRRDRGPPSRHRRPGRSPSEARSPSGCSSATPSSGHSGTREVTKAGRPWLSGSIAPR